MIADNVQLEDVHIEMDLFLEDENWDSENELSSLGLEAGYWLSVLSEQVGITSKRALEYMGPESYVDLEQFVRTLEERNSLHKLLNVKVDSSLTFQRHSQREQLNKRQKHAKKLLSGLKQLHSKGQSYNDEVHQQYQCGIREMIQLPPKAWTLPQCDVSLNTAIVQLQHFFEHIDKVLQGKDLSDSELLSSTSNGLALQGILLSRDLKKQLGDRENLLETPQSIQLMSSLHPSDQRIEHFSSQQQMEMYKRAISKLGYSVTCTAGMVRAGIFGFNCDAQYCEVVKSLADEQSPYCSSVKYFSVPLASFLFSDEQLKLSKEALDKLKEIDNLLGESTENEELLKLCEEFFTKFGSHATKGPLTLGGIYWCECSSKDFKWSDLKKVQTSHNDAIDKFVSSFDSDIPKEFYDENAIHISLCKTVSIGDLKVINLPQWKVGLIACNCSWNVIDRGMTLIPVWKIIDLNHRAVFQNGDTLSKKLYEAWDVMSKFSSQQQQLDSFHQVKTLSDRVQEWNSDTKEIDFEENLKHLADVKFDLIKKYMDLQAWPKLYLSQPSILQYLKVVMEKCDQPQSSVKANMQQVVERMDLNLMPDLPHKACISNWLYDTHPDCNLPLLKVDFEHFVDFIKHLIDNVDTVKATIGSKCAKTHTRIQMTTALSCALQSFVEILDKSHQKYEKLLILSLIFPFVLSKEHMILNLLSPSDINFVYTQFKEKFCEFFRIKEMRLVNIQAYIFKLAVSTYCKQPELRVSAEQVNTCVVYMRQTIGDELHPQLAAILTKYNSDSSCRWEQFLVELECLMQAECKHSANVEKLLTNLDLIKFYPQKLSLQETIQIRHKELKECTELEQLPQFILQYLMSYDNRCRTDLLQSQDPQSGEDSDRDSDAERNFEQLTMVHPMDALLAVFHCADDFLRQDMMTRLAMCQYAVPFLLPNPFNGKLTFPIWAMKSIVKEWKYKTNNETVEQECPIVNYLTPIISFLRLGKHKKSKSFIANQVVSGEYDHFFHFDCDGGRTKKLLVDGLVELCWYLPAGRDNDVFSNALAFLNLRGDASHHLQQIRFMSQISFMSFVLLTEKDLINEAAINVLKHLLMEPGGVVLLLCESELKYKEQKEKICFLLKDCKLDKCQFINLNGKNLPFVRKSVHSKLNKVLSDEWENAEKRMKTLSKCTNIAGEYGIVVDEEHNDDLRRCQKLAHTLKELIDFSLPNPKERIFQLQSRSLWHRWATFDKEGYQQSEKGPQTGNDFISRKKTNIRKGQLACVEKLSPAVKFFMESIMLSEDGIRKYFLQCLRLDLNDSTQEKDILLRQKYTAEKQKLSELVAETSEQHAKEWKERTIDFQREYVGASFGIEHLLREVGQVYEAIIEAPGDKECITKFSGLPLAAAKLLIDGYPLELMDGDTAHVPLTWVTAILDQVTQELNDPQIFVLSVLGLQSTGKSTLLNAMFGLQFNVSAGRCTRGVFIKLLPTSKELKKITNCQYILVVDTEGLRAPELQSTMKHDNELATFAIGLANLTIINLYGEVPGDMDDILQTVMHAFIRMSSVELRPSCLFVHQNVGSLMAGSKGRQGRLLFRERLDEMTRIAAKEEGCEGVYESFSEVIRYTDHVVYFPALWKGDLPMAPVNPSYSEHVQNLKHDLVEVVKKAGIVNSQPLSVFTSMVGCLWKALLHENFIFSFKNTLEIAAHNALDKKFSTWAEEFQYKVLNWELTMRKWMRAMISPDYNEVHKQLTADLSEFVEGCLNDLKEKLTHYIETHKYRDLIVKWKGETVIRFRNLVDDLKTNVESSYKCLMVSQQAIAAVEDRKDLYRERMLQRVKSLVSTLEPGQHLSEDELRTNFDEEWTKQWKNVLEPVSLVEQDVDIEEQIIQTLKLHFGSTQVKSITKKLMDKKLAEWGESLTFIVNRDAHVELTEKPSNWLYDRSKFLITWTEAHRKEAQLIIDDILRNCERYLDKEEKEKFSRAYIQELIGNIVLKSIDSASESKDNDLSFKPECRIDLSLTVCGYALKWFREVEENYKKEHSPIEYLEQMKQPFFTMFVDQYRQVTEEKAAASTFCQLLSKPLQRQISDSLGLEVVNDMIGMHIYLHSKPALKAKILLDLGNCLHINNTEEGLAIDKMIAYLLDTERSTRDWIKHFTQKHCEQQEGDDHPRLVHIAKRQLLHLISFLNTKVSQISKSASNGKEMISIKTWVFDICTDPELISRLKLDVEAFNCKDLGGIKEVNVENFVQEVQQGLAKLKEKLDRQFEIDMADVSVMDSWRHRPFDLIFDRLSGCSEQCPFCKEQCECTNQHHASKHSVQQHRPQCLGRYKVISTQEIRLELCTTDVGSDRKFVNKDTSDQGHPYKEYQRIYPHWSIPVDLSSEASMYWKWFVGHYHNEIAEHFDTKMTTIPDAWKQLRWEDVKRDLQSLYNV